MPGLTPGESIAWAIDSPAGHSCRAPAGTRNTLQVRHQPEELLVADIKIYLTDFCPYCVSAKRFLQERGHTWQEVRVDLDPAARAEMRALANRTSVPQIFINGTHVGGFDDMIALDRKGGLAPLLEASP